jgi:hypothetical protein
MSLVLRIYVSEKGGIYLSAIDQSCSEIESADSVTGITKLIEDVPNEIVEYVKDRTTGQDQQIVHGKFSKQTQRGNWLRSKRLLVTWSFGRINLDLRDTIKSLPSGGIIDIELRLKHAKCRITIPETAGVVEKIEMINQGSLRCSKAILNRSHNSLWTVILRGRIVSSKIRIVAKSSFMSRIRHIVQK